jgi:hypothetical protein
MAALAASYTLIRWGANPKRLIRCEQLPKASRTGTPVLPNV